MAASSVPASILRGSPKGSHLRMTSAFAMRSRARLVARRVVWLGFSPIPREGLNALQFLPLHFPVPAGRAGRLFSVQPARPSGAGDLAGAGVAGFLFRQQLAVRGAAAGVDRLQLPDRMAADRSAAAPRAALCGADRRRCRRSRWCSAISNMPASSPPTSMRCSRPALRSTCCCRSASPSTPSPRSHSWSTPTGAMSRAMRCRIMRCSSLTSRI